MKILLALCLSFTAVPVLAYSTLDKKVSLTIKGAKITEVLNEISTQTRIKFVVDSAVSDWRKSSIQVKKMKVKDLLNHLSQNFDIAWVVDPDGAVKISAN